MVQNLILKISAMTFTFDLEIWFKVIAYPVHKNSVYVKYEPDLSTGKEYLLWQYIF